MAETVAGWTFTPPIGRDGYLIRRPGEAWIEHLHERLHVANKRSDPETISIVLNNLALVLFKAGLVDEAAFLCRAHYRRFASFSDIGVAQLSVQPWINEGRLLAFRGNFAGARHRFSLGPRPETVVVGSRTLSPVDADTVVVRRNVAVIDGFMLELRADGLDAAGAHLTRLERSGVTGKLLAEFRLQLALARGRVEEASSIMSQLREPSAYPPMLACYDAAIALVTHDVQKFACGVLLLAALLDGWAETEDDVASILHGLMWLGRIGGEMYQAVLGRASQDYLCRKASEIDDEELRCLLSGRRYDPLPEGSGARNLAVNLLREAFTVLRGTWIAF